MLLNAQSIFRLRLQQVHVMPSSFSIMTKVVLAFLFKGKSASCLVEVFISL